MDHALWRLRDCYRAAWRSIGLRHCSRLLVTPRRGFLPAATPFYGEYIVRHLLKKIKTRGESKARFFLSVSAARPR